MAPIEFSEATLDAGAGAVLAQAMRDEIASVYDGLDLDAEFMPRGGVAELSPPDGGFLVGWRHGEPVCCGGLKRIDGRTCEIKRMYVAPRARGQGVARQLLRALEQLASERGYVTARLDTGPRQPHAQALYRSAGYIEIPDFNHNPVACYWAEKPLAGDDELDLDAYLARIGLSGRPSLAELHRAHVSAIPFENLDPLRGVAVSLALADIERKLVAERRGGYCFEHNLLFAAALRALGAEVEPMLARVGPRDDPERSLTHLLLRVRDGDGAVWHADVGFGAGTLLQPIPFGPGAPSEQQGWRRRVVAHGTELVLQSAGADGVWADLYRFIAVAVPQIDIELSNWFTCTSPRSMFVRYLNVTVHRADGSRLVLRARGESTRVIEQTPSGETVDEVDRQAIPDLLAARFGLPGWTLDERGVPVPGAPERP